MKGHCSIDAFGCNKVLHEFKVDVSQEYCETKAHLKLSQVSTGPICYFHTIRTTWISYFPGSKPVIKTLVLGDE